MTIEKLELNDLENLSRIANALRSRAKRASNHSAINELCATLAESLSQAMATQRSMQEDKLRAIEAQICRARATKKEISNAS